MRIMFFNMPRCSIVCYIYLHLVVIWLKFMVNIGKYNIHSVCGLSFNQQTLTIWSLPPSSPFNDVINRSLDKLNRHPRFDCQRSVPRVFRDVKNPGWWKPRYLVKRSRCWWNVSFCVDSIGENQMLRTWILYGSIRRIVWYVHLPNIIDTTENHPWNWYKYAINVVNSPIFRAIFCLSMVTAKKQVNKHHRHAFNKKDLQVFCDHSFFRRTVL